MSGDWQAWIGRQDVREDRVDPALAARWCATLDRPLPADGTAPQGLHWCLCTPDAPTAALGRDGHPDRTGSADDFLPPIPLPRRMWAASTITFHAPLTLGATVRRTSTVQAITPKSGGSGPLVFVEIAHETRAEEVLLVREVQTIVYRGEAGASAAPPAPVPFDTGAWTFTRTLVPEPPLLFRYSALTFNSHRIHYDLPYATEVEGYRGLVVHGPLMASLLLDLARQHLGDNALRTFTFRALAPAIAGEALHLCLRETGETIALAAFSQHGQQVVQASASPSATS